VSLTPAVMEVHRQTGARVLLISAGRRPLGALDAVVDRVTWDGARTDALLATADCGMMPLEDSAFARGKCAYKLLQYGAAGLPVVASPVGVNASVVERLHGLAAGDASSWVEALVSLLREPEGIRRARGRAARRAVEEHYSFAAWRGAFQRALRLPVELPGSTGAPGTGAPGVPPGAGRAAEVGS
jgi:glycosyltransferase involved in cell wall biosynthesis